ncbi:MAG: T9SS type A sorting domain-containing protein [Bacteroidia bacterium]|nr:T9SS type A sorting domain-containing protein [Bacteroidia bacterium]
MKIQLLLFFTFIFISLTQAATKYYSILDGGGFDGNWNANGYWSSTSGGASCGCNPGNNPGGTTEIYIRTQVNLNVSATTAGILDIASGKSLQTLTNNLEIKTGGRLYVTGTLKVWDLTFSNGSTIDVGSGGKIIVLHNFINKNNSDAVTINGTITVSGNFDNGNGGVIQGSGSITASSFTGPGETFGFTNSTIPTNTTVSNGSLPIEIASFTSLVENGVVKIDWATSTEINNDFFTIERSKNGVDFEEIEKIKGQGNSNTLTNYNFIDSNPLHGNSYYRLRQTDFDGKSTLSDLISVNLSKIEKLPLTFEVFPNPITKNENSNINITAFEPETEVLVVVRNLLGQELYSKVLITDFSGNSISAIDLENNLPAGTYIIIGTSLNQTFNKYLIIK